MDLKTDGGAHYGDGLEGESTAVRDVVLAMLFAVPVL